MTVCIKRFSSCKPLWYIALFTVSYFLLEILRIPCYGRKRNLDIFCFLWFLTNLQRLHHQVAKFLKIIKIMQRSAGHGWAKKRSWLKKLSNVYFIILKIHYFFKKENITCQCFNVLIPSKKILPCNLTL